jgi:hypothetical protein
MKENEDIWYKLDNAGKLFPSIATYRSSTVFRVSATLTELVDIEMLQLALVHLIKRMPYYQVYLKRGLFWYYMEKTDEYPFVELEKDYPCMYLSFRNRGYFPFRVLHYYKRISLEMAHFISDGTGAIIFLKSLVVEYFKLKGVEYEDSNLKGLILPGTEYAACEYEDAFMKYFQNKKIKIRHIQPAMHFPFPLTQRGKYHIVTGIIPVKKALELSKSFGVTMTTFFLSLYFESIFDYIKNSSSYLSENFLKPVTINIPVNLRSIFPSKTMRNFFLSISPSICPDRALLSLEKIMEDVDKQMKIFIDKELLLEQITRNIKTETSLLIRLMPLLLKDAVMPIVYSMFGENGYTSSISNIGKIEMPCELNEYIERFEFYPSPSRGSKIKTTMVTYKDHLYFTFGKITKVNIIERIFLEN